MLLLRTGYVTCKNVVAQHTHTIIVFIAFTSQRNAVLAYHTKMKSLYHLCVCVFVVDFGKSTVKHQTNRICIGSIQFKL